MKTFGYAVAAAALLIAAPSYAGETLPKKEGTKSQGSLVGVFSSQVTGNGATIGGGTNGTGQTTEPGSRAEEVQGIHAAEGRGREKPKD